MSRRTRSPLDIVSQDAWDSVDPQWAEHMARRLLNGDKISAQELFGYKASSPPPSPPVQRLKSIAAMKQTIKPTVALQQPATKGDPLVGLFGIMRVSAAPVACHHSAY